ncbi:hypothetical protein Tco_1571021 [Tanacetum coccineum]
MLVDRSQSSGLCSVGLSVIPVALLSRPLLICCSLCLSDLRPGQCICIASVVSEARVSLLAEIVAPALSVVSSRFGGLFFYCEEIYHSTSNYLYPVRSGHTSLAVHYVILRQLWVHSAVCTSHYSSNARNSHQSSQRLPRIKVLGADRDELYSHLVACAVEKHVCLRC